MKQQDANKYNMYGFQLIFNFHKSVNAKTLKLMLLFGWNHCRASDILSIGLLMNKNYYYTSCNLFVLILQHLLQTITDTSLVKRVNN